MLKGKTRVTRGRIRKTLRNGYLHHERPRAKTAAIRFARAASDFQVNAMYFAHFGLHKAPFKITPDTELFYAGGQRGDVLEALLYAVNSGEGIIKVVGEVGSGKTMLCRMLEVRLPERVDIVYLANPSLKPDEILHAIAIEMDLDVSPSTNRLQVLHNVQQRLLQRHADNRRVVVFVEEAQSMPLATLEEIRLLSNLETQTDKLLQIVLFGQPELNKNLAKRQIRQLKERIVHSFTLQPFDAASISEYVRFRMHAAGYRGPDVFSKSAYKGIAKASAGLIRRVNILADKSLLAAFADNTHIVTARHVEIAIADSEFRRGISERLPEKTLAAGLVILLGAVVWSVWQPDTAQMSDALAGITAPPPQAEPASPSATVVPEPLSLSSVVSPITPAAVAKTPAPSTPVVHAANMEDTKPAARPPSVLPAVEAAPALAENTESANSESLPVALSQKAVDVAHVADALKKNSQRLKLALSIQELSVAPTKANAAQPPAGDETETALASAEQTKIIPDAGKASVRRAIAVSTPVEPSSDESPPAEKRSENATVAEPQAPPPVASPSKPESLVASRMDATRDWLKAVNRKHYSIQLLLTNAEQTRNLEAFLKRWEKSGRLDVIYVYRTVIRSKVWLGVLYQEYPTIQEARTALENLPEELKRHRPFIRNVRDVG